jgi:hypothetical protein
LIIERYLSDAVTVYAEFEATDTDCELRDTGEILLDPITVSEIIPTQSIGEQTQSKRIFMPVLTDKSSIAALRK